MSDDGPRYGLFQAGSTLPPYVPLDPEFIARTTASFAEMGRMMNAYFPAPPEQGYLGNRCGWYPEKPKRRRRSSRP